MTNSIETAGSCSNKITKAYQKQPGVVELKSPNPGSSNSSKTAGCSSVKVTKSWEY